MDEGRVTFGLFMIENRISHGQLKLCQNFMISAKKFEFTEVIVRCSINILIPV